MSKEARIRFASDTEIQSNELFAEMVRDLQNSYTISRDTVVTRDTNQLFKQSHSEKLRIHTWAPISEETESHVRYPREVLGILNYPQDHFDFRPAVKKTHPHLIYTLSDSKSKQVLIQVFKKDDITEIVLLWDALYLLGKGNSIKFTKEALTLLTLQAPDIFTLTSAEIEKKISEFEIASAKAQSNYQLHTTAAIENKQAKEKLDLQITQLQKKLAEVKVAENKAEVARINAEVAEIERLSKERVKELKAKAKKLTTQS